MRKSLDSHSDHSLNPARERHHANAKSPSRLKRLLRTLLPFLLLSSPAFAQNNPSSNPAPPPFTPSETIEAGSAVAFPVDI